MVLSKWLVCAIAVTQTTFVVGYATFRWWTTPAGRAIMLKGLALAAAFDLGAASYWWPHYPGRLWSGIVIFVGILCGSAYQAVVVWTERSHRTGDGFSESSHDRDGAFP